MQKEKTKSTVLPYVQQWLSIGISIVALAVSIFGAVISVQQGNLEKIFQPLYFHVSRGEQSVSYRVSDPDGTVLREIPGYEIDFSCKTGAYQEFAQIYYDGTELELKIADMDVLESGDYVIRSTGQIPPSDHLSGGTAYDYYFVRTVAASGQKELWLIYYELDLLENTVRGPFKASDTILLLLQDGEVSPKDDMLKDYQKIYDMVNQLPGS